MTRSRSAPMGLMACVALVCMTLLSQPFVYAESASSMDNFEPGIPMKSTPVNLMPRSFDGQLAQMTLSKFRPTNKIQLRFVDASDDNYADHGACHHVDMDVELKSDDPNPKKQHTIQSINPFAFQHAVRKYSCTGTGKNLKLNLELDPRYSDQIRRWNVGSSKVFAIVIPHDYVDLKNNKACFVELSEEAKKWAKTRPMETVVKMVKNPRFLNAKKHNVVSFSVVKTNIWSRMSREQSVHIAHRDMDMQEIVPLYFQKRSTAYEKGPMWNFERDLSPATKNVAREISANNVKANIDKSSVKGYAQADMAWTQTCIWNIFTSRYSCVTWGLSAAKVSGMAEINHSTSVDIKKKNVPRSNGPSNPLLTLTRVNVTTPTFTVVAPIPMLGFSVPGVFDLGANVAVAGAVSLNILVQATEDLLLNTGSATSCPWTIDWDGGLTSLPKIQFGTCTLPGTPKLLTNPTQAFNIKSHDNAIYMGPHPRNGRRVNSRNAILGAVPTAPARGGKNSRQTAYVRLGLDVIPSLNLGLKVFGFSAINAGVVAPLNLGINTNWDTQKTEQCPANNVALFADGQASVMIEGTFFGFTRSTPPLASPRLDSPAICIKV